MVALWHTPIITWVYKFDLLIINY